METPRRRLLALKALAADGTIPKDHPVPCLVVAKDAGTRVKRLVSRYCPRRPTARATGAPVAPDTAGLRATGQRHLASDPRWSNRLISATLTTSLNGKGVLPGRRLTVQSTSRARADALKKWAFKIGGAGGCLRQKSPRVQTNKDAPPRRAAARNRLSFVASVPPRRRTSSR